MSKEGGENGIQKEDAKGVLAADLEVKDKEDKLSEDKADLPASLPKNKRDSQSGSVEDSSFKSQEQIVAASKGQSGASKRVSSRQQALSQAKAGAPSQMDVT